MSSRTEPASAGWQVALGAVLALAAVLRLPGLDAQLWFDEIATLVISIRQPLAAILTEFPGVNQHPFYSVLAHGAVGAFGESPWVVRLPAMLFGVVAVWTVWDAGRAILTRGEALAAAVLVATSSHHIWFSQNARGYTMLASFTLVTTVALLRIAATGERRHYVLYTLAAVAGVYTHLTMAFVLAAHVLTVAVAWLLGVPLARRFAIQRIAVMWAMVIGLIALTYAPYVPDLLHTFAEKAPPKAAKVATAGRAAGDLLRGVTDGFGFAGLLTVVVLAATGGLALLSSQPFVVWLLVSPAIVTLGTTALLGQPLRPRFLFNLSGAAALFVAAGAAVIARALTARARWTSPAAQAACLTVLLLPLAPGAAAAIARNAAVPKQDFAGALALLDVASARGERIVGAGTICLALDGYFHR
ncbi:MAG: glycosyltransferase family 39 protein, partial [Acidobacteria bacterium]|nr:glycosyltransferase family 39 protein [Acidobacteriota bacterium]